ncbi:MAG: flippase-like domain-containing protein [candidate division WOR-3 bacterium]|nr:MAG: flippase-like domain-containing protein [candidate division WOR-3 bacterium]
MKVLQRILTVVVVCVIFIFLIRSLILNWSQIPFAELRFNAIYVIISFLCLAAYFSLLTRGWSGIVTELGSKVPYGKAFWIVSTSQIAKYLPGGIWYTLGRVYLARTEKVKEEIGLLSVVFETFLLMLTNLIIFLASIIFIRGDALLSPVLSIVFITVILILLYPPLLNILLNVALRILKKPTVTLNAKYISILRVSTYFFALWFAQIAGFYFLINSIYPAGISLIPNLAAAYTLSWITGFIVLFAPGGLGVREGMMTLLLSSILPVPLAIAISFLTRVWIAIFEVLIFFIGQLVRRRTNLKNSS